MSSIGSAAGRRGWLALEVLGWSLVLSWLAIALPWLGAFWGLDWLGYFGPQLAETQLIAYHGLFTVGIKMADHYFTILLVGAMVAKLGQLLELTASKQRKRYVYITLESGDQGQWFKLPRP